MESSEWLFILSVSHFSKRAFSSTLVNLSYEFPSLVLSTVAFIKTSPLSFQKVECSCLAILIVTMGVDIPRGIIKPLTKTIKVTQRKRVVKHVNKFSTDHF